MSHKNPYVRININQNGAKIGIGSLENLTTDQICGSRGNSQSIPDLKVSDLKSEQPNNPHNPRRSIAIGVDLNQYSNNLQYNPLENPKNSNTNSIAKVVGDFVKAVITSFSVLKLSGTAQFSK